MVDENCGNTFNIWQLLATSYGNENFVTSQCNANWVKFIPFFLYLITWSYITIWSSHIFISEILKHKNSFDLRRRIYLLTVIAAAFELCSICLVMAGVQHWVRYLIYVVPLQAVRTVVSWSINAWFDTTVAITHGVDDKTIVKFKRIMQVMDITTAVMHISCCVIGPVVAYHNGYYTMVNWFYSIRTCVTSLIGVCVCLLIRQVGNKLHAACMPDDAEMVQQDTKTTELMHRLKFLIKIANNCLPSQILFSFFPFWMLADLYGAFWFQYTINEFNLALSVAIMAWLVKEKGDSMGFHSGSTVDTDSHRKSSGSTTTPVANSHSLLIKVQVERQTSGFSFTVDDINATTPQ